MKRDGWRSPVLLVPVSHRQTQNPLLHPCLKLPALAEPTTLHPQSASPFAQRVEVPVDANSGRDRQNNAIFLHPRLLHGAERAAVVMHREKSNAGQFLEPLILLTLPQRLHERSLHR